MLYIAILTDKQRKLNDFLRERGYKDAEKCKIVSGIPDIRGREFSDYWLIEGHENIPKVEELIEAVKKRIRPIDNPVAANKSPDYLEGLNSVNDPNREALLNGTWK